MAGKPKLHYFNARGRMESIRWLLAAAGVEFEEQFLASPEDLEKLRNDGSLMFQQVPMVEIDGMKLAQTRAILNYIAAKYNLYGKDIKERALIDMYSEGMADLNEMIMHLPLCPPHEKDAKMTQIREKTTNRYFPAFEKVLKSHGQHYLVGNRLSRADIHLVELIYYVEEIDPSLMANFPLLKALKTRISNLPPVKKFLQPGSHRKPPVDAKALEEARKISMTPWHINALLLNAQWGPWLSFLSDHSMLLRPGLPRIDMYSEGIADLNEMTMRFPLCPPDEQDAKMTQIREKTTNCYFPAFEKVLKNHGQDYLIGNRLKADIYLVELIYHHELGQRHGTKSPSEPFEGINFDDTLISDFRLLEL